MLEGLLLKESLKDLSVLSVLQITKTETWNVDNAAADQPRVWTALFFAADENQSDSIAEKVSRSLRQSWYVNASTSSHVFVIFPDKVFRYLKGDRQQRAQAIEYGQSIGIPSGQLDWSE